MAAVSLAVALLLDRLLGEVSRFHPLVGFGHLAGWLEGRALSTAAVSVSDSVFTAQLPSANYLRLAGAASWFLLVVPPTALLAVLVSDVDESTALIINCIVLYFCIGGRSLAEHARAILLPLSNGELDVAREQLARIVSRDTQQLDESAVASAAVESVLENGSDALLAPIFWFLVGGAPAVLCYRLSNTLDAMWGYRNTRYLYFGFAAAKMDDLLNWVPARLCAFSYALAGRLKRGLHCWQTQASEAESPNAGPVMAAGAGALGICVGGSAIYGGELLQRPLLGEGDRAQPEDIERALALLWKATAIWMLLILIIEVLIWA